MTPLLAALLCALCAATVHGKAIEDERQGDLQKRAATVCYARLGCFNNGDPWFSSSRPVNLLPQSPDHILTKYLLHTRETQSAAVPLDARYPDTFSTEWPAYNTSRPTKFVIHGFLDDVSFNPWINEMATELLNQGDYNVVVVDWHHGNTFPYTQATGNSRLIGAQVADLINTITTKTQQAASSFHIIGHSLGAHIGGYAGDRVIGLGRITGMDPAGPYFDGTDPVVRLDMTDADFVDVIHSDAETLLSDVNLLSLGFGARTPMGHADYYPNAGHDQPGCDSDPLTQMLTNGLNQAVHEFGNVACNHLRSWKFFTESINSECLFTAVPCASEDDFLNQKCNNCSHGDCGRMGFHATKPATPTKYYLTTSNAQPFCEWHVEITVHFHEGQSREHERGLLTARIQGDKGSTGWVALNEDVVDFQPGQDYTYNVGVSLDLGQISHIEVKWHHVMPALDPSKWNLFGLRNPTIKLDGVDVEDQDTGVTIHLCSPSVLASDHVKDFDTACH